MTLDLKSDKIKHVASTDMIKIMEYNVNLSKIVDSINVCDQRQRNPLEFELNVDDNIVVLPENATVRDAIQKYIEYTKFYVEYLHWNNKHILDGFVDENNNMIFINDKYDKRAVICELLYENYRMDNFAWSNCELLYQNYRRYNLA